MSAYRADGPGSNPGRGDVRHGGTCKRVMQCGTARPFTKCWCAPAAETQDRTENFQIFGLALSQLSYRGLKHSKHFTAMNITKEPEENEIEKRSRAIRRQEKARKYQRTHRGAAN